SARMSSKHDFLVWVQRVLDWTGSGEREDTERGRDAGWRGRCRYTRTQVKAELDKPEAAQCNLPPSVTFLPPQSPVCPPLSHAALPHVVPTVALVSASASSQNP
ncbi:hypothetical protein NDU88_001949, partial [Pleurodeles waltl]